MSPGDYGCARRTGVRITRRAGGLPDARPGVPQLRGEVQLALLTISCLFPRLTLRRGGRSERHNDRKSWFAGSGTIWCRSWRACSGLRSDTSASNCSARATESALSPGVQGSAQKTLPSSATRRTPSRPTVEIAPWPSGGGDGDASANHQCENGKKCLRKTISPPEAHHAAARPRVARGVGGGPEAAWPVRPPTRAASGARSAAGCSAGCSGRSGVARRRRK